MDLTILYRGPLASCDYDCPYCPFAKRRDSPDRLRADRADLDRFTGWAREQTGDRLSVLFTPWGEGLTRSWYREALVGLSHEPHIDRVAIQTNLSCRTEWLDRADRDTVALWCTYHPGQTPYERFLDKTRRLAGMGIRFSVGVVGLPEHLEHARRLRGELPEEVYLWVNAAEGHTYTDEEAAVWTGLDPLFPFSRHPHRSAGRACRTGSTVVSVDGEGDGAALPLRQGGAGQPLRRFLPRGARAPTVPAGRLRLPHRVRPPGDTAPVRRLRGRCPGTRTDAAGATGHRRASGRVTRRPPGPVRGRHTRQLYRRSGRPATP